MARTRERHRLDGNHADLVALARMLGFQWEAYPPLDGWAGLRDRWRPVEIKEPKRKGTKDEFTDQQQLFFGRCERFGATWVVWYTPDDVLKSLREW